MRRKIHPPRLSLLGAAVALGFAAASGAATITVTTGLDVVGADGACSLREAILAANTDAPFHECPAGDGEDHIGFAFSDPETISLVAHLPAITESLAIDGPGADRLTLSGVDLYRPINVESPSHDIWLVVQDLTLANGRSRIGDPHGGGAKIDGGASALFERVHFVENRSEGSGGGLTATSGIGSPSRVKLIECAFRENVAEGQLGGGGLSTTGDGSVVTILRSVFADNEATLGFGGGILGRKGIITVEASTISGNSASLYGGGIHGSNSPQVPASLLIRDTTIIDNTADLQGGGLNLLGGSQAPLIASLENSVVAGNFDAYGQRDLLCDPTVTFAATGSSLIGANGGCEDFFPEGFPNANGDFVGTVAAPIDPRLEPLASHGGPTPAHRPTLNPLSPLVDQGTCPDVVADQRLYGSPQTGLRVVDLPQVPNAAGGNGCDIGAVEVGASPLFDDLIFADGFELGHALRWSSETP